MTIKICLCPVCVAMITSVVNAIAAGTVTNAVAAAPAPVKRPIGILASVDRGKVTA